MGLKIAVVMPISRPALSSRGPRVAWIDRRARLDHPLNGLDWVYLSIESAYDPVSVFRQGKGMPRRCLLPDLDVMRRTQRDRFRLLLEHQ